MSLIKQRVDSLEIHFQTLELPPPFSHTYDIKLDLSADLPQAEFDIQYTHRQALSEEEILEEGFTPEDDFQWKGTIPKTWKYAILDQLRSSKKLFDAPPPHAQQVLSLTIRYEDGELVRGIPSSQEPWIYFSQEIIQAIYELGEKEMPLEIIYLEINGQEKLQIKIRPSFSQRKVNVTGKQQGKVQKSEHEWQHLKPLLEAVYLPDYDSEQASEKEPKKSGSYISPGDGLWYTLGKAVTNPGEKKDALGALQQKIKALLG